MLAQTLRNNLQTVKELKKGNTGKFSKLLHSQSGMTVVEAPKQAASIDNVVKLINKKNEAVCKFSTAKGCENMEDYIVENPEEMVVDFSKVQKIELDKKLPFFKSITAKLACIYN